MNDPYFTVEPKSKVSVKDYVAMMFVCLFVSACTNFMHIGTERAKTIALYRLYQNLQKQVRRQQEMIDLVREEIEEMADAEAATQ